MQEVEEFILEEFRKVTPGYGGMHVIGPFTIQHEHPDNRYEYTERLVAGWEFAKYTGFKSVFAVVNTVPYVEYVEYKWISKKGNLVPGHFMCKAAIEGGNVINLYAERAKKALVVSLTTGMFRAKSSIQRAERGRAYLAGGGSGMGRVAVHFTLGAVKVTGAAGRGISTVTYERLARNFGDYIVRMLGSR